jgi:uncharacterized protein (DUF169 family)
MNSIEMQNTLQDLLGLAEPVAVTFHDTPPEGVERIGAAAPAGCSYWKLASDGQRFYTDASDHLNCSIGAYTHGAEITAAVQKELEGMVGRMVGLQYLKIEEVAGIPRRKQPLRFVAYAPLSRETGTPDVVLLRGSARQMMLLAEAAMASGLMSPLPVMGRPACAVVPAAMESGKAATSLGCIGNRVYTGLGDGEFYLAVPGGSMGALLEAVGSIVAANRELEQFHRERCISA